MEAFRSSKDSLNDPKMSVPIRMRCFLISLLLMPINAYWIIQMEITWYAGHPTTISLFFNVMLFMVLVGLLNAVLRWIWKPLALNPAELVAIYAMLCMASAMAGHDMIQVLTPILTNHKYGATPENNWNELFAGKLPKHLIITADEAVKNYHEGKSTLYLPENYRPWFFPVLAWSGFLTLLVLVTMFLNVLFLKEWTRNERLTFPVVQLPLVVATRPRELCRSLPFLIGFAVAGSIAMINGLHHLYPDWPLVPVKRQSLAIFQGLGRPWNAVGWFPVSYYPCVIGLSYLMPIDLMFSCWFFFLYWKGQRILASALGLTPILPQRFVGQQAAGAYLAIAACALWIGKRHLKEVLRKVINPDLDVRDRDQPMSYRTAFFGAVLGFVGLVWFGCWAGLSLEIAVIYFLLYLALAIGIARMRATCGPPAHDLHFAGPGEMMAATVGTEHLNGTSLGAMSLFWGFNRAYRGHPTAHSLECFQLGQQTNGSQRAMFIAQVLGVGIGCLVAFWAMLHIGYGSSSGAPGQYFGREPYRRLGEWLTRPTEPNEWSYLCYVSGFAVVVLLPMLKMRFPGLPFHPIGYAVSASWSMHLVWFPILIGWICKLLVVRYTGGRGYRTLIPFFMGLILGDYVVGGGWCLASLAAEKGMYAFWY